MLLLFLSRPIVHNTLEYALAGVFLFTTHSRIIKHFSLPSLAFLALIAIGCIARLAYVGVHLFQHATTINQFLIPVLTSVRVAIQTLAVLGWRHHVATAYTVGKQGGVRLGPIDWADGDFQSGPIWKLRRME